MGQPSHGLPSRSLRIGVVARAKASEPHFRELEPDSGLASSP